MALKRASRISFQKKFVKLDSKAILTKGKGHKFFINFTFGNCPDQKFTIFRKNN